MFTAPKSKLSQIFSEVVDGAEDESKKRLVEDSLRDMERDLDLKIESILDGIKRMNLKNSLGVSEIDLEKMVKNVFSNLSKGI